MKRLVFTPAARDDLMAIGLYIADDDPERAMSFVAELEAKPARQPNDRAAFRPATTSAPVSGPPFMAGICCFFGN